MKFKNKENPSYIVTDIVSSKVEQREIWHSRSVALCCALICANGDGELEILITQRGDAVDNPGKWCLPCGYLDWDETIEEGVRRELYEEIGVLLEEKEFEMYQVTSDPNRDAKQNVSMHFMAVLFEKPDLKLQEGEVVDAKWVKANDVDLYEFAFNHAERAKNLLKVNG